MELAEKSVTPSVPGAPQLSEHSLLLATTLATHRDRKIALGVAAASVAAFLMSAPFAKIQLTPLPAFVPFYQSAVVTNDLITAVLLYGQFSILRSRALLLLASAYLFTAIVAIAHTFSFPGLFSTQGLGAGPQTTALHVLARRFSDPCWRLRSR